MEPFKFKLFGRVRLQPGLDESRPPRDVAKQHPDTGQCQDQGGCLDGGIPDLAVVAPSESCAEVGGTVGEGEGHLGNVLAEEFAEGLPAVADVVLEQAVSGDELTDEIVVGLVDFLASVLKVALEQAIPEEKQHGPVEGKCPVEMGDELGCLVHDAAVDGLGSGPAGTAGQQEGSARDGAWLRFGRAGNLLMPGIRISVGEDDLGVWVGGDQLGGKGGGWEVADGLAVAQQLVPVRLDKIAVAVPLCADGSHPHLTVAGGLGAGGAHVVGLEVAEGSQGCADG